MKIMPAQQFAFTPAYIEETGRDPAKVKLSYAHADRSQRKINKICGNHIKKSVSFTKLRFAALGL